MGLTTAILLTASIIGAGKLPQDNAIVAVDYSPNDFLALTAGADGAIRTWYTANGQLMNSYFGHVGCITDAEFSSDGQKIISIGQRDNTIRLWDTLSGQQIKSFSGVSKLRNSNKNSWGVNKIAWLPDGIHVIAAGSGSKQIRIWNTENGQEVPNRFPDNKSFVYGLAVSPSGKYLAWGNGTGKTRLWNISEWDNWHQLYVLAGHSYYVRDFAFNVDDSRLMSVGSCFKPTGQKTFIVWDIVTGQQVMDFGNKVSSVHCVALMPSRKIILGSMTVGTLGVWDIYSIQNRKDFTGFTERVLDIELSSDSRYILVGGDYLRGYILDAATGNVLHTLEPDYPHGRTRLAQKP